MGEVIEGGSSATTVSTGTVAWGVALVVFVAGDILTTTYGLQVGVSESNPVPAMVMDAVGALPAMVGLKLLAVGILWAVYRRLDERYWPETIPMTLTAVGGVAVGINTWMIALHVL